MIKNLIAAVVCTCGIFASASTQPYSFVVVGDTAYRGQASLEAYDRLIGLINETNPAFTIHVGDIWGASVCVRSRYEEILKTFNTFAQPVVLTPGDNEWTDCHRHAYGNYDNVSRLQIVREVFYKDSNSLGKNPMRVVRQGDVAADHAKYVENARWVKEQVLFLTLNVPGSHNNLLINKRNSLLEVHERNVANIAWLRDSFRIASEQNHAAVVIALHAEMFEGTGGVRVAQAYSVLVEELKIVTQRFMKPILLVHGDQHRLTLDRPLSQFAAHGLAFGNLVRLQVYGDPEVRAMRVSVNPSSPHVFGFEPLYLE